ncbi:MAG: thiamine phosphate synthase [Actinomycetota bacterium]
MDRRERLSRARLYLVTDGTRPDLEAFLDSVLENGVDIVQLREKTMEAREQIAIAKTFRAACDRHGALFIVNDRADLAVACDADGVHVGQGDLPPEAARMIVGAGMLIGRSTHAPEETARAMDEDTDYVACGPVYETPTKPGRPATGLEIIRFAAANATKPWFAIGGLDPDSVEPVIEAGARRIVIVRAIADAQDPIASTQALAHAIRSAHV